MTPCEEAGDTTGATLPNELLAKLRVVAGDTLFVTEGPDGRFRLTPYNPEFAARMEVAEGITRDDRDILHDLSEWPGPGRGCRPTSSRPSMIDSSPNTAAAAGSATRACYPPPSPAPRTMPPTVTQTLRISRRPVPFGIAKNLPFVDGNKRTAWVVARLFLALNGVEPAFSPMDPITTVESLAAGRIGEEGLAAWFREGIEAAGSQAASPNASG